MLWLSSTTDALELNVTWMLSPWELAFLASLHSLFPKYVYNVSILHTNIFIHHIFTQFLDTRREYQRFCKWNYWSLYVFAGNQSCNLCKKNYCPNSEPSLHLLIQYILLIPLFFLYCKATAVTATFITVHFIEWNQIKVPDINPYTWLPVFWQRSQDCTME